LSPICTPATLESGLVPAAYDRRDVVKRTAVGRAERASVEK
jgi:hypothetical protein